jgi:hypothetical protein
MPRWSYLCMSEVHVRKAGWQRSWLDVSEDSPCIQRRGGSQEHLVHTWDSGTFVEFWKSLDVICQTWFRVRESRARNYVRILLQRIELESMPCELAVLSSKVPRKLIFQNISFRINLDCVNGFLNVGQNTKSTRSSQLPGFQKTHTTAPPERLGQLWNCATRQITLKNRLKKTSRPTYSTMTTFLCFSHCK